MKFTKDNKKDWKRIKINTYQWTWKDEMCIIVSSVSTNLEYRNSSAFYVRSLVRKDASLKITEMIGSGQLYGKIVQNS